MKLNEFLFLQVVLERFSTIKKFFRHIGFEPSLLLQRFSVLEYDKEFKFIDQTPSSNDPSFSSSPDQLNKRSNS